MIDILRALATESRPQIEAYCEARSRAVPFGDHKLVCRVLGTYFMMIDTRDLSLSPHLAMSGYWEFWISQAIARRIKPGMRCIDVGANFGYFTLLLAALVGEQGFVQAWEPQRKVRDCLDISLPMNGFQRHVEVVPAAASSQSGEAVLWTPTHFWGSTRVIQEGDSKTEGERCELRTLDSANEGLVVDFIKIDAEGHEPEVWQGMSELRQRSPGLQALIEFTPSCYADPGGFLGLLRDQGFRISIVQTDGDVRPAEDAEILACERFEMLWLDSLTAPRKPA